MANFMEKSRNGFLPRETSFSFRFPEDTRVDDDHMIKIWDLRENIEDWNRSGRNVKDSERNAG